MGVLLISRVPLFADKTTKPITGRRLRVCARIKEGLAPSLYDPHRLGVVQSRACKMSPYLTV